MKRIDELDKFDFGQEPDGLNQDREYKEFTESYGWKYYGEVIKGTNINEGKGIAILNDDYIYLGW